MEDLEISERKTPADHSAMDDFPPYHFRCPISMELMKDPVTISTGVTYERNNIEKWFFSYKKKTCPATMQSVENFDMIPNHTLKRLIVAWQTKEDAKKAICSTSSTPRPSNKHDEIQAHLNTIVSSPFKVNSIKKLRSIIEIDDETKNDFIRSNGVEVLVQILDQILLESSDFTTFRACEEALCILHQLPILEEGKTFKLLSKQESTRSMAIMLQRGSAEARLHTITIFKKMAKTQYDWSFVVQDQGIDFFKSLLELVSDEICSKASSCALEVLIEILTASKKNRLRAIEAGAVCVLIELLPDSNRSKCEKMLQVIKLLCERAEGRQALVEHGLGIVSISKKMLHVSNAATKIGVKIIWLICNFHPTERVLEEMLICGPVKKLVALLHMDGRSSTKDKVVKIFKMHGNSWKQYPCFPCNLKDYLGFVNDPR
ncbi:E3 ubiquitin-protein ligase PUB23-like [Pyrus x bretschneideri]|uniref:E3 ubiquitin-protein ligase PUB23-like n=1 Tax=Pyrus x bretschneideri TaxID=225117 RepID=UPI002030ED31|nr:E3 ubiquitin-protein ligase PUB23-like [Pyrus x bretschneideri]